MCVDVSEVAVDVRWCWPVYQQTAAALSRGGQQRDWQQAAQTLAAAGNV